jgi:hypothetical protein
MKRTATIAIANLISGITGVDAGMAVRFLVYPLVAHLSLVQRLARPGQITRQVMNAGLLLIGDHSAPQGIDLSKLRILVAAIRTLSGIEITIPALADYKQFNDHRHLSQNGRYRLTIPVPI